ncbi:hypothetical protein FHX06_006341 [Rhizobium sp. BK512]|nr:hypothetical protein [Rhizobium sp. BK512]
MPLPGVVVLDRVELAAHEVLDEKKVRGIDFKIGLGVAWNREDPTAGRDDIIDIVRSLVRPGR